ncbi:MAG: putative bicarbonate transporter, IctB family [Acaryochloris sp. RU_4_1]|nr:putative bicarbonate transporter, IctB family [Acaryochloris sp. SU_5_25]NJM65284.1 putative bicarbonate transporter, IctB family [Acaryochloris sp. RU_4_1]NJR54848.1 putative bicarbonate transporter, IctB family [Acaryochloris sp. CRU_2_0]
MNTIWQNLTLTTVNTRQWRQGSLLWRSLGFLREWRQGSWLLQWHQEIGAVLLTAIFVLAPFVPNTLTGFLAVACGGFWLLLTLSDDLKTSRFSPIYLLVSLFWGITVMATVLSPVRMAALSGLAKMTLYLFVFALTERVIRSPRWRSGLITVYLHIALIVSIYGVRQKMFGAAALATWVDPTSTTAEEVRVYSYLGNPNLLAAYILPALIFSLCALVAWQRWGAKLLAATMLVIHCACMYWTGCRGAWIGLVLALFVMAMMTLYWLLPYLPRFWQVWIFPLTIGTIFGVVFLGILLVAPLRNRVLSMFSGRADSSNNFRINVWEAVQGMIRKRPLLGIGPGNAAFNKIYPLHQKPNFNALSSYSIYLETLVETGAVGFACLMWLIALIFQQGWVQLQKLRRLQNQEVWWLMGAIATIIGLLIHGFVDTVWYRPEVNTLWWFMVAIVASYYRQTSAVEEPTSLSVE